MSKTDIPINVLREVWWKAAGRCEFKGCNKPLYLHGVTMDKCKIAEFAHIIADSPDGPRGTEESKVLAKEESNIMLLCPECHKYVDTEGRYKYDADSLRKMKRDHEDRMRYLTGLSEDLSAHIVTYGSPIGDTKPIFDFKHITTALLPSYYPDDDNMIDLGGNWYSGGDWEEFWANEEKNLVHFCKEKIIERMSFWETKRIALFAFAPMPLLVRLGTLLNCKYNVEVFQRHRSGSWAWEQDVRFPFLGQFRTGLQS